MSMFFARPAYLPSMPARVPFSPTGTSSGSGVLSCAVVPGETATLTPETLTRLHRRHGDVFAFSYRSSLHYFFSDPAAVSDVLINKEDSFCQGDSVAAFSAGIGWGLLADQGSSHIMQKRSLSSALRGAALDAYTQKIRSVARQSIDTVQGTGPIPLLDWCRSFSQDAAEITLFPRGRGEADYSYHRSLLVLNEYLQGGDLTRVGPESALNGFGELLRNRERVLSYVENMVKDWRSRDGDEVSLMDFMIESPEGQPPTTSSLHAQVALFLQAAVETTASLIAWSLMWLNRNPQYWEAFRRQGEPSTAMEIVKDPKPQAVINEVLRLNPPAWFMSRVAVEPVEIAGVSIVRGARVVIAPWISHRSADYFSEPTEFRPERWLESATPPVPRGVFIPFGLGSHICVGERLARLTATIFLSELAVHPRTPQVEVGDGEIGTWGMVTNPRESVTVDVS